MMKPASLIKAVGEELILDSNGMISDFCKSLKMMNFERGKNVTRLCVRTTEKTANNKAMA